MPKTPSYDSIRNLMAEGQTESAVNSLMQLARDKEKEYFTSALLLKNRLETLQQNEIEGVLDQGDARTEWARISKGVMNLVEQMERRELPKKTQDLWQPETAEPTANEQVDKMGGGLMKWLLPLAAVGIVMLLLVPKLVGDKNEIPASVVRKIEEPSMQELPGQLIWYDETPVADAIISIRGFDQDYTTRSDSKGNFKFRVNPDLIDKQVEFNVNVNNKDQTESIRLSPENLRRYTIAK